MSYPSSVDVSSGQPTAVSHYNNLRADALYLGSTSSHAAALGSLLQKYESNMNLVYLATNRVRCVATSLSPVCIVVNGYPLVAVANVDLATAPSGAAAVWYLFANRTAGSTTFTITANTSSTEAVDQRIIGQCYWNGSALVRDSVRCNIRQWMIDTLKYSMGAECQGRLTLSSGAPATTSNVSGGTVFFSPFKGNVLSLYVNDAGFIPYTFSEVSTVISASSGTNIDIFAYDNSGNLALEAVDWASDTARSVAIDLYQGVYLKNGDYSRRYLGTVRTSSSNTVSDSGSFRGVWNYYNRILKGMNCREATSHTYNGALRKWNNSDTNNLLECVIGVIEDGMIGTSQAQITGVASAITITQIFKDGAQWNYNEEKVAATATAITGLQAMPRLPTLGYQKFQVYEYGNNAGCTFTEMLMNFLLWV